MKTSKNLLTSRWQHWALSFALLLSCAASSHAIDQLVLTSGEILEGKILADVPNRHVDIQLTNGQKRRYPRSQVSSVERDVPSDRDNEMLGVNRRIFFGPLAGGILNTDGGELKFVFGAKLGFNASNLGGSTFAPTLSYRLYTESVGSLSATVHFINAQFLFRRIGASGFYIGPQIGLGIGSLSSGSVSVSGTAFLAGADLGYDIQFSDSFSIGPDVQFDYSFSGASANISFGLSALFHFE